MLLSVAMIGLNEESCIRQALKSVESIADEIIFVDTGSTDSTIQIAEEFGAKLIRHQWIDNFSVVRNIALDNCSGEWILSLDCDEYVDLSELPSDFSKALLFNETDVAYAVEIENLLPGGEIDRHVDIRLFRNTPAIRFCNPIHESVSPSILRLVPNAQISMLPLKINHSGYRVARNNKNKLIRNRNILLRWTEDEPDNPYAWYKLGLTLKALSAEQATACLFRSFELLIAHEDRGSFAFRFELLESLKGSLEGVNKPLEKFVNAQWEAAFS